MDSQQPINTKSAAPIIDVKPLLPVEPKTADKTVASMPVSAAQADMPIVESTKPSKATKSANAMPVGSIVIATIIFIALCGLAYYAYNQK